ncbi:MAG: ORF6N domain-containing protein [Candidatus Omnitrophota bacterium]|nr:ORF6N domain-containing protein [Candidatus Omnitrophota bacterium]
MLVSIEKIENKIFQIRGKKVMFDSDLAMLYEVPTKTLLQSVKRNTKRFPYDCVPRTYIERRLSLSSMVLCK